MREVMKIFKSNPSYWAAHQHLQCKQFFFESVNGFESLTHKLGIQTATILECMLSPKASLYTGIHEALVHSSGKKIRIRVVEVSCRMLLYLLTGIFMKWCNTQRVTANVQIAHSAAAGDCNSIACMGLCFHSQTQKQIQTSWLGHNPNPRLFKSSI